MPLLIFLSVSTSKKDALKPIVMIMICPFLPIIPSVFGWVFGAYKFANVVFWVN